MKHSKSLFALMLLLCFLVSLILPTVSAATGTVSKNTAARHITCTALSSQAQTYYTAGTYDYATISGMNGVYSTDSWTVTQNNPIYTALQTLMKDTHTNTNVVYSGYATNSLYGYWNYTDTVNSSAEYLLFYCDKLMADVQNTEGYTRNGMEREHVWCKSKGDYEEASNSAGADLHHMRPSFGYINNVKSNRSFGNVEDGQSCTLDGVTVFTYGSNSESGVMEVNDNIKGDIARILLYVYVRWGQPNLYSSYSSNEIKNKLKTAGINTSGTITGSDDGTRIIDNLDTLLEWVKIDPVDTWEMQRNDQIENVQGNRNVFIDYPEFAWLMFGMADRMPTDMPTPSGMASNGSSSPSYKITNVTVNNSNYGSAVITNNNTVTAIPNENYYLQSANSSSGTVSINGNVITVSDITANATVNVVFDAYPQYTVAYSVLGSVSSTISVKEGSSITLPSTAAAVDGYTFVGWSVGAIDPESPTVTLLPESYTPTGNVTFYAVYSRTQQSSSTNALAKMKAGDTLSVGDKLVVIANGTDYIMYQETQNTSYVKFQTGSTSLTAATVAADDKYYFDVTVGGANGTWKLGDTANGYLHNNVTNSSTSGNNLCCSTSSSSDVTLIDNGDGTFAMKMNGRYLSCRTDLATGNANLWRLGGTSSTGTGTKKLDLYKFTTGATSTIYYTTKPTVEELQQLKIASASLILNGKIDVLFNAQVPDNYTDARMVINGTDISSSGSNSDGTLRFVYTGINPQCMGDSISAMLYATKDNKEESVSVENYSVRQYCVNMLAKEEVTGELRTLLSDLLSYGAAAQVYTDYKTNALVNVGSDIINPTYSTFTSLTGFGVSFNGTADDGNRWVSAGLTLTNSVAMTFRFYAESIENLTINVAINGRTQTFTTNDFSTVGGKMYEISFTGISAEEFGDNVTASFERNNASIGNTVSYSVNTYVQSKQTDTNEALQSLVKALHNYGVAAEAYKN